MHMIPVVVAGRQLTALVVEDDPRIASFLIKALNLWGYAVEWVVTGAERWLGSSKIGLMR